ncbi:MerR family transcriptional regulator [Candidatus Formimonas warabiya]|uniref:MerR family transcriptional regulator n=1 Tax=Formimonas warabiya TaxID=1761012 RepID=A0A3G1KWN1_FORW1|nr:MerR family transcriptional regulator [Candidatus Formimonas warabiya]ATW26856.1 MerR family transcriptional regulator [Candidatus Formimonas warabiya]
MNYSIKEVSQRFNISPYTLRYYEKEGLLPSIHRTPNGTRTYSDVDLEWLHLICCMRATGMSIAYIKKYVDLCRLGKDTIPERRQIILRQKEIIENHIKEYQGLLKLVNKKLKYYDHIADPSQKNLNCNVMNVKGTGPLTT